MMMYVPGNDQIVVTLYSLLDAEQCKYSLKFEEQRQTTTMTGKSPPMESTGRGEKNDYSGTALKTSVQEVPKTKSLKSREMDRTGDV